MPESAERVVVTRTEIGRLRALAAEALTIVDAMLERPEPAPVATSEKGWPLLGEPGTAWERHDDPGESRP